MVLRATCCVYQGVARRVAWCDDGLPPPPGWQFGVPIGGPRMSPTPRSAKYGATHGCNPSRGSKNVRLRLSSPSLRRLRPVVGGEVLCFAESVCGGCARWWAVWCSASQSRCAEAAPDGKPRSGVPDRNPALTQLCRGLGNGSHDCVPKVRPCSPRCVKARLKSRLCSEMPFPPAMWLYLCDISLHAMWRMRCHKGKCIKLWLIEINMTDILKKYQIFLLFINNCEYLCAKLIKTNYFL